MKKVNLTLLTITAALILSSFVTSNPVMYMISTGTSKISWSTTNDEGKTNTGTIKFKSGNIKVDTKQITGGFAYVNMQSLSCNSIADAGFNKALVDEMRSAEVMNVVKYKEMTFKIVKAVRKDVAEGQPNYDITFEVGLKGIKKQITLPALVGLSKKATTLKASFILSKDDFSMPNDINLDVDIKTAIKK